MHMLRTRGIKPGQIITWARILNQFETIEQFDESLRQYGDMIKLASVRKEEAESYELRLTKTQSQVQTLEKERAKIEGAIESLRVTVVKELKAMTEETEKQIKAVAASEVREIQAVGQSAKSQFDDCLTQLNALIGRAYQLGEKIGQMGMHLEKYEAVKDILDSHAAASEAQK
jgi:chromosome segregation ATPase